MMHVIKGSFEYLLNSAEAAVYEQFGVVRRMPRGDLMDARFLQQRAALAEQASADPQVLKYALSIEAPEIPVQLRGE